MKIPKIISVNNRPSILTRTINMKNEGSKYEVFTVAGWNGTSGYFYTYSYDDQINWYQIHRIVYLLFKYYGQRNNDIGGK